MSSDTPANPQGTPEDDELLEALEPTEAVAEEDQPVEALEPTEAVAEEDQPVEALEPTEAVAQEDAAETAETVAPLEEEETSSPAESEAEGSAAAETGVDKRAAEAVSPKGARRRNNQPEPASAPRRERKAAPGVTVSAQAKYVRTSARKARIVCDHIRGKDVEEARAILAFTPRGAAEAWSKLLESAVANAEHNHELVGDELRIAAVHADEGPTLKRFRPRAMGRATKIRKRTSHLTITLTPKA